MSRNINFNSNTGKYSFFSVKEKPWHNLGQIVQDYPTSEEAIKFAGLDFTVEKRPLFTFDTPGHKANPEHDLIIPEIKVPNFFATLRTDTDQPFGVVGKDYQVVQNKDAFTFFDAIVGGYGGIKYETAGALGNGEKIFITAKLPDFIKVGKDDLIEKYLFLTTSHDGSGAITAAFTPVRIECQNTLNAAMRNKEHCIRIRHTAKAEERLRQAHTVMGMSNTLAADLEEVFNHWTKVKITDAQVRRLIEQALAPSKEVLEKVRAGEWEKLSTAFKNTCDSAFAYAMGSESQQMATTAGTVFGAYNAVTGYYQNVRNYKDDETKVKSLLYGGNAQQRSQKAFDLCENFTAYGADSFKMN